MKTIISKIALIEVFVLLVRVGHSQGFGNLNFESTTLASNATPTTVATTVG
jgi:hypothetical protein